MEIAGKVILNVILRIIFTMIALVITGFINYLYCKKTGSICERKACIYRNESMAWTYRFKLWLYKLLHKNNKDR